MNFVRDGSSSVSGPDLSWGPDSIGSVDRIRIQAGENGQEER